MHTGYGGLMRQAAALKRDLRLLKQAAGVDLGERSPLELARELKYTLDPWQERTLMSTEPGVLLLVSRQGGKSTVASLLALHTALFVPGSLTLIVAPSERQAKLLLKTIRASYARFADRIPALSDGQLMLELRNGSTLHALPGKETTLRGFSNVDLLIIDEAARVMDVLYQSVRPMLAVSGGRLVGLSTPWGKRGWFFEEWEKGGQDWHRERITAFDLPRIDRTWLDRERQKIGDWWFNQEYGCQFVDTNDQLFATDLVYEAVRDDVAALSLPAFRGIA